MTKEQILAERDRLADIKSDEAPSAEDFSEFDFKLGFDAAVRLMLGREEKLREAIFELQCANSQMVNEFESAIGHAPELSQEWITTVFKTNEAYSSKSQNELAQVPEWENESRK